MNISCNYFFGEKENKSGAMLLVKHGDMKQIKKIKNFLLALLVLSVLGSLFAFALSNYARLTTFVFLMLVVLFFYFYYLKVLLPKELSKSNDAICGTDVILGFYDGYFYEKNENPMFISETSERYENLQKIVETETAFLLFSKKNTYVYVPKSSFNPEDIYTLSFFFQRLGNVYKLAVE